MTEVAERHGNLQHTARAEMVAGGKYVCLVSICSSLSSIIIMVASRNPNKNQGPTGLTAEHALSEGQSFLYSLNR